MNVDWFIGGGWKWHWVICMTLVWHGYAMIPVALSRADLYQRHSRVRVKQQDFLEKMFEQEPGEHRKIPCHTWKHVTCYWWRQVVIALCQWQLMVSEATHEASWLPFSSFLVVCFCSQRQDRLQISRGSLEYRTILSTRSCPFYFLQIESWKPSGTWGEVMQKEPALCNSFFSRDITDSKQKAMYKAGQRAQAVYLKRPSLEIKFGFHSHAENASWYFIHLFTQALHTHLDSRWE